MHFIAFFCTLHKDRPIVHLFFSCFFVENFLRLFSDSSGWSLFYLLFKRGIYFTDIARKVRILITIRWNSSNVHSTTTIYSKKSTTVHCKWGTFIFGESSVFSRVNNHHFMWPYYLAWCVTMRIFFSQLLTYLLPKKGRFSVSFFLSSTHNTQWKPRNSITLLLVFLLSENILCFPLPKV